MDNLDKFPFFMNLERRLHRSTGKDRLTDWYCCYCCCCSCCL